MVQIVGIVNLTSDSFSDGGRYLETGAAIAHGERLVGGGAHWLDLGPESSNPAGARVPDEVQLARLRPVLRHFVGAGVKVSVDTHRPAVMAAALDDGASMINDITAVADPQAAAVLARYPQAQVVLMFARNARARAEAVPRPYRDLLPEVLAFFRTRLAALADLGIDPGRTLLDPGMGFFLGSNAEPSLWMLRHLGSLGVLGRPLYVSTSRKSFVGALVARPPLERGAGTLASELWAAQAGASFIRTHDARALADALAVWTAIAGVAPTE